VTLNTKVATFSIHIPGFLIISDYCPGISCYISHVLDNGKVTAPSNHYQSVVYYECDYGYTLFGPSTRKCLIAGTWSEYTPICVADNVTTEG